MKKEFITHQKDDSDGWICICGNVPAANGFSPCDIQGNEMEPTTESDWGGLYVCEECGRIIKQDTLEVIGRKSNSVGREPQKVL